LSGRSPTANRVTTFEQDPVGNLLRVIFPDASTKAFGYDGRHVMTSETDGRLNTTLRAYDFADRVVSATLPDGSERFTTAAELVGLVDPDSGEGTESNPAPIHEPSDAVSTYTDGEGRTWTMEHGLLAQATKMTDPAGLETIYDRDADGNAFRTEYPSGHVVSRTFDSDGNVLTETDETLNGTTTFTYHPVFRDQVATVKDPIGQTTGKQTVIDSPQERPDFNLCVSLCIGKFQYRPLKLAAFIAGCVLSAF
jgi:YD repeat-containing protein